jgi:hypothetical protein
MSEINIDVVLPSQITTDVFSPSLQGDANVFIPGLQGPQGQQGPEGPVNQFKTIKVYGQSDLIPTGIESLKFIGQTGINILTDDSQNPKSITINDVPLSGYFKAITDNLSDRLNQSGTSYYNTFAILCQPFPGLRRYI